MALLHRGGWLLLGLALLAGGCSKADTERLKRVACKVGEKVDTLRAEASGRLPFHANLAENLLQGWVSTRLHLDRGLSGARIQVEARGSVVTLSGSVADLTQRRRAVDLAETTVGVEKVIDQLKTPGSD